MNTDDFFGYAVLDFAAEWNATYGKTEKDMRHPFDFTENARRAGTVLLLESIDCPEVDVESHARALLTDPPLADSPAKTVEP